MTSRHFIADKGDARLRLDQAIVRRLADVPRLSRTRVQRWIDLRLVLVNDRPATRAAATIVAGDRIDVRTPEALVQRARPEPESAPLDILFEDDHLLALNKPPGLIVHPAYKHASGTLFNAVLGYLARVRPGEASEPRLLQRLDKDTSGVLLVSKTYESHIGLQRAMAAGTTRKEYLAVVRGRPRRGQGAITLALGIDPGDRRRVMVREDGRASETRYEVLARAPGAALLRCELITGRTHQIRVHLASSGWPIVGDTVYGIAADDMPRQALHAWRLTFTHPVSGSRVELTAPVPADMEALMAARGLRAAARARGERSAW